MVAAQAGEPAAIDCLLRRGADVNAQTEVSDAATGCAWQDFFVCNRPRWRLLMTLQLGWTALMIAAQNQHTAVVESLLRRRANVNMANAVSGTLASFKAVEQ